MSVCLDVGALIVQAGMGQLSWTALGGGSCFDEGDLIKVCLSLSQLPIRSLSSEIVISI